MKTIKKEIKQVSKDFSNIKEKIFSLLENLITESKVKSKTHNIPVIRVNVFGYTELGIINDRLTFLDRNGYHYSVYNGDCTLDDLIDILNTFV